MEGQEIAYKQVSSWDTDDVVGWIKGLDWCLSPHIPQFQAHCICGTDLLKLSRQQLDYLKVTQVGHQELLLEAIELLSLLENSSSRNSTIALASTLSKKTSQLVNALSPPSKKMSHSEDAETAVALNRTETTAGVMIAAKALVNWLDRHPSTLIADYNSFRQDVLKHALDLSNILQNGYNTSQMLESCRAILKLTSTMMSPQNFSAAEPVHLVTVSLTPREETGLGFSMRKRQGSLLVSKVTEMSPAALSGKIHVADEVVQINHQNVAAVHWILDESAQYLGASEGKQVGWEVGRVLETLKASGHRVALVLNTGPQSKRGPGGDTTDNGSCDPLPDQRGTDYNRLERPESLPADSDIGGLPQIVPDRGSLTSPNVLRLGRDSPLEIKRTVSTPITDSELAVAGEHSPAHDRKEEKSSKGDDFTDEGSPQDRGRLQSFEDRLTQRTASESGILKPKKDDIQNQYPAVAYRTQVVGGVVMRIPIKVEEQGSKGKKDKGAAGKKGKGKKHHHVNQPADHHSPVEAEPSLDKGKAIFSDPKEVTIGGQAIKQVTVTTTSEPSVPRDEIVRGKKMNPALMVPCFQLKGLDHEGWMYKLGGSGLTPRNWRRRWFVLKDKKLYYYKTSFDISALGIVDLVGYKFESAPDIKRKNGFKATRAGARTYCFQADTPEEMMRWIQILSEASEPDSDHALPSLDTPASIEVDEKSDDEL